MNLPIRVGVVGTRFGAAVHVPAFRADGRCRVVALAGQDQVRAHEAARAAGVAGVFPDALSLISSSAVDAVALAVPPASQPALIEAAARAGKGVFCEKPLAASYPEAEAAVAAAEAAGIVHAVDFLFPELETWRQARAAIAQGAIGPVRHFAYQWAVETWSGRMAPQSWKSAESHGGGTLGNFVSHVFYNVMALLGPVHRITGFSAPFRPRDGRSVSGLIELDDGATGTVVVATDAFLGGGHVIEVFGEAGTLVLRNSGRDYVTGFQLSLGTRTDTSLRPVCGERGVPGQDGRVVPVAALARRFLDAVVAGGGTVTPNLHDALRVQAQLASARGEGGAD